MDRVPTPLHCHPTYAGFRKVGWNAYQLVDQDGNGLEVVEEWIINELVDEDDYALLAD